MTAVEPGIVERPPVAARGAPRRAAKAGDRALAFGATCPNCGGTLRVHEGERSVRCIYCNSALLVAAPRGTQSFILEPEITPGKARLAAIRWISEESGGRLRARDAAIMDQRLVHVPFWRLRGRVMGWLSGERTKVVRVEVASEDPRSSDVRSTMREERSPYSRLLFKRIDWSAPACVLPCLGLQGISFRTDFLEWDVLDAKRRREHPIALPTRSERAARRDAMGYIVHFATAAATRVRASRFHLFDDAFSLYYYPVYILRYRHGERIYIVTVDGCSGLVVRGEAPAPKRVNARRLFFAPAALAALAAAWLPLVAAPVVALYALDTVHARAFLPPHEWISCRLRMLLGSEE
jgi:DNA-directed RNA polymerase subunit RPC12/RpoP